MSRVENGAVELCAALAASDAHEAALAVSLAKAATLQQQLDALTTVTVINVETGEDESKTLSPETVSANQKRQRDHAPAAAAATRDSVAKVIKTIKVELGAANEKAAAAEVDVEDQMDETQNMINFSGRQTIAIDRLKELAKELGGDPSAIQAAGKTYS